MTSAAELRLLDAIQRPRNVSRAERVRTAPPGLVAKPLSLGRYAERENVPLSKIVTGVATGLSDLKSVVDEEYKTIEISAIVQERDPNSRVYGWKIDVKDDGKTWDIKFDAGSTSELEFPAMRIFAQYCTTRLCQFIGDAVLKDAGPAYDQLRAVSDVVDGIQQSFVALSSSSSLTSYQPSQTRPSQTQSSKIAAVVFEELKDSGLFRRLCAARGHQTPVDARFFERLHPLDFINARELFGAGCVSLYTLGNSPKPPERVKHTFETLGGFLQSPYFHNDVTRTLRAGYDVTLSASSSSVSNTIEQIVKAAISSLSEPDVELLVTNSAPDKAELKVKLLDLNGCEVTLSVQELASGSLPSKLYFREAHRHVLVVQDNLLDDSMKALSSFRPTPLAPPNNTPPPPDPDPDPTCPYKNSVLAHFQKIMAETDVRPTYHPNGIIDVPQGDLEVYVIGDLEGRLNMVWDFFVKKGFISVSSSGSSGSSIEFTWNHARTRNVYVVQCGDQVDAQGMRDLHNPNVDISVPMFMDYLYEISQGHVLSVIGNHELWNTKKKYNRVMQENVDVFKGFSVFDKVSDIRGSIFSYGELLGKILRRRYVVLRINNAVFTHAGLTHGCMDWYMHLSKEARDNSDLKPQGMNLNVTGDRPAIIDVDGFISDINALLRIERLWKEELKAFTRNTIQTKEELEDYLYYAILLEPQEGLQTPTILENRQWYRADYIDKIRAESDMKDFLQILKGKGIDITGLNNDVANMENVIEQLERKDTQSDFERLQELMHYTSNMMMFSTSQNVQYGANPFAAPEFKTTPAYKMSRAVNLNVIGHNKLAFDGDLVFPEVWQLDREPALTVQGFNDEDKLPPYLIDSKHPYGNNTKVSNWTETGNRAAIDLNRDAAYTILTDVLPDQVTQLPFLKLFATATSGGQLERAEPGLIDCEVDSSGRFSGSHQCTLFDPISLLINCMTGATDPVKIAEVRAEGQKRLKERLSKLRAAGQPTKYAAPSST